MKKLLIFILFILLPVSNAYADCRGRCNGHGGIFCADGITRCVDGSPLYVIGYLFTATMYFATQLLITSLKFIIVYHYRHKNFAEQ